VGTLDGEHTLKNGMTKAIAEISDAGNIRLDNGWMISGDAGHFRHGYVESSFGAQGRTVQRAILAMSSASLPATNQEQMYVSSSRAKERMTLYTDCKQEVRDAVQRSSKKLLALDMPVAVGQIKRKSQLQKHREQKRRLSLVNRVRAAWAAMATQPQKVRQKERQADHGYSR
jgi:hypothetical protein